MKRAKVAMIIGSFVIVSTAINLSFNVRAGSLARPPIYDDVLYLLDAYRRLAFGGVNSLASLIGSFVSDPPHAPMSTLTAMLGYTLLGPHVFSAYAANIWLLAIFAAATYLLARRYLDDIPSITITGLMLFAPASHTLITEFRPDMGAGVILGCALLCLLHADYATATKLHLAGLALLVICAIMAKPSAFVATIPMLGLAALLGIFRPGFHSKVEMASSARGAIFFLATTMVLLVPCVVVWGPGTYSYVYDVLVTYRDMWRPEGGPLYHWAYNSFGFGGKQALGLFLWLGLLSIAVDCYLSFPLRPKRDSHSAITFYLIVALLYCGIAVSPQKTVWQGSLFHFPFLLATTLALSRNLSRIGMSIQRAVPAILLAAAAIFLPAASFYQDMPGYQNAGAILASVSKAVAGEVSSLRSNGCKASEFKLAAMNPWPVTVDAVALDLALNFHIRIKPLNGLTHIKSAEEMDRVVDTADFVLLARSDDIPWLPPSWLPGARFSSHTSVRLTADAKWHLISSTNDYELFAKRRCSAG